MVQFRADANPKQQCFTGRIEHVRSGLTTTFESVEALRAFIAQVLPSSPSLPQSRHAKKGEQLMRTHTAER